MLNLLEGSTVKFPAPKNWNKTDVCISKDIPIFATGKSKLVSRNLDPLENEMMDHRWVYYTLHWQIPKDDQEEFKECGRCFAQLVLLSEV